MKIAIDIDEVVARYVDCYCEYHNEFGGNLRYEDWKEFSFSQTLGISHEEAYDVRQNFLESECFDRMELIEGAKEGINFLAENYELVFITVRPKDHEKKTIDFFNKHFPGNDFEIIFAGAYMGGKPKDEICRGLGINLIIEDCVGSQEYAENGMRVILFDKAWNREVEHENVVRCYNWKEILSEIRRMDNGN